MSEHNSVPLLNYQTPPPDSSGPPETEQPTLVDLGPVTGPPVPAPPQPRSYPPAVAGQRPHGPPPQPSPTTTTNWLWVLVPVGLLALTIGISITLFFVLSAADLSRSNAQSQANANPEPVIEPTSAIYGSGGLVAPPEASNSTNDAVGGLLEDGDNLVIQPWDGNERFTVLLMGMDLRPGERGAARTDTLILVSLDPGTDRVGLLSIPRDLYVDIPGFGIGRINTAYGIGEQRQPGGGPRLAMQTVQYNFGIRVNEYAVVNFSTFIRIVDLLGGIQVNVTQPISDPTYPDMHYGYDPFYLNAGPQILDGATALKYARSRHGSDDIDRARRQQEVLFAIRDKAVSTDALTTLAPQAPILWSELSGGVATGLALDQIVQLAWWLKDVPANNFTTGVVGWEYVLPRNWQGQDILVPNRARLGDLMVQVFGPDYR